MCTPRASRPLRALCFFLGLLLLPAGCADAPSAPSGEGPFQIRLLSRVSLSGPPGASAGALDQAFDMVDRFRLVVRRVADGQVVADVVIAVTPGQDSYTLSATVPVNTQGELFEVTVTALAGDLVLFESPPVRLAARLPGTPGGNEPQQVNLTLNYAGPGATAASVAVNPGVVVLGVGGTIVPSVQILDQNGAPIPHVPLAWASALPAVVSVTASGVITGVGEGVASVSVTTPTGLSGSVWVYVLSGEIAFVRNGHVFVGPVAGTNPTDLTPSASGAQTPAWDAGGQRLFYVEGAAVHLVGRGALGLEGAWPSLSPDGLILAVERGGRIFFANDDGTFPTPGPTGSTPVWAPDGEDLYVGGGSVERIAADGSRRTTVAAGTGDQLPAVSASGRLAFVGAGGTLFVSDGSGAGRTPLLPDGPPVASRPTWSPSGGFLVFTGNDGRLYVVAADGSAPAAPLPLGSGQDPAWRGGGAQTSPRALSLQGIEPVRPAPGQEAEILGSGFDLLIPRNNRVHFPGAEGPVEAEVLRVAADRLRVRVPSRVRPGTLRVTTRSGQATLAFEPGAGSLKITARTTEGDPLPGVALELRRGTQLIAQGSTDNEGAAAFEGLAPEDHTLAVSQPQGFQLQGAALRTVRPVVGESITEELLFKPQVARILIEPEEIVVEVGRRVAVTARPLDIRGRPITRFQTVAWRSGSARLLAEGDQLLGTVTGVYPSTNESDAEVRLGLDNVFYGFSATVTSFIEGTVSYQGTASGPETVPTPLPSPPTLSETVGGGPAPDVTVELWAGETLLASIKTDASGAYRFDGLLAGSYTVKVPPHGDYKAIPASHTLELGANLPSGQADFVLSLGSVASVEVAPDSVVLRSIGEERLLTATARTAGGEVLTGRPTVWISTHPGVATVSTTGLVTAVANGTAKVIATVDGVADTAVVVVQQEAQTVVILAPAGGLVLVQGDSAAVVQAQALDANGHPIADPQVVWSSSDSTVAVAQGWVWASMPFQASVIPNGAGTAAIQAQVDGAAANLPVRVLGHCSGPVTIATSGDLEAFSSSGCGRILGDLIVEETGLTDLTGLEYLIRVDGSVFIRNNPSLQHIGALERLRSVDGDFFLIGNPLLSDPPSLAGAPAGSVSPNSRHPSGAFQPPALTGEPTTPGPSLRWVGGDLVIRHNPRIYHLNWLPRLEEVGGALDIGNMEGLANAEGLRALVRVGGLLLDENPALRSLGGFPVLQEVGEIGVWIDDGAVELGFPALETVMGSLVVRGYSYDTASVLQELAFPSLRSIGEDLEVYDNLSLESLLLPDLEEIGFGEGVVVEGPPGLSGAPAFLAGKSPRGLSGVEEILEAHREHRAERAREKEERAQARLERRRELLQSSEALAASTTPGQEPASPAPTTSSPFGNGEAFYAGSFYLSGNLMLTSLSLPNLRAIAGGLEIGWGNDALEAFEADNLEEIGQYMELYATPLWGLSLPKLRWVGWDIWISENDDLEFFSFPALEAIASGGLYVESNASLVTWSLPVLEQAEYLDITENPALTQIPPMPSLATAVDIAIWDNPSLASLAGFSSLRGAYRLVLETNALPNLNGLENLEWVTDLLKIQNEGYLVNAHLPALRTVRYLYVHYNPLLTSFSAPNLEVVTGPPAGGPGYLAIENNAQLTSFSFPSLHTIVGDLFIVANPLLPHLDGFDPDVLEGDLVNLFIAHNASLNSLAGLYGLGSHDMNDVVIHGNLTITYNPSLGDDKAWAFVDHLNKRAPPLESGGVAGMIIIHGNGGIEEGPAPAKDQEPGEG